MKPAFLIVDVQKDYCEMPGFKEQLPEASMYINEVSGYFREAGLPVIHIQHKEKDRDLSPVSEEILQEKTDIYVTKTYGNAFWKTDLEEMLKKDGIDFLVISGLAASQCVLSTYNGALERDFTAVLLQNGVLGHTIENVRFVQKEKNIISYPAVKYLLKQFKG